MVTIRVIITRLYYVFALLPLLTVTKAMNLVGAIFLFLIKSERSVKHPPILYLDITNKCNFTCLMCAKNDTPLNHYMHYENPQDMDFKTMVEFLRTHAKYLCLVRLHGGEPLIYENIDQLIDVLNVLKIPFNIVTNGSLLSKNISEKLVNSYCVGIGFSLDTSNPEHFRTIRKGGDFAQIVSNIDYLNKLKKEKNARRPILSASMCALSINVKDMAELVTFCKAHDIPALSACEASDLKTNGLTKVHLISENIAIAHDAIKEAVKEAKRQGIILRLRFPSLLEHKFTDIPYHSGNIRPRNCLNLYAATWFLPDFTVIGCSAAATSYGNLKEQDFEKIWNSKDYGYVLARNAFRRKRVPIECEKCSYTGSFFS